MITEIDNIVDASIGKNSIVNSNGNIDITALNEMKYDSAYLNFNSLAEFLSSFNKSINTNFGVQKNLQQLGLNQMVELKKYLSLVQ